MPLTPSRALVVVLCLFFATSAAAFSAFTIEDIRVDGVQRLGAGTVLTYLPVTTGDTLDAARAQQAIRALYQTGLFKDVSLSRDGNTLVVHVAERPVIASFTLEGNERVSGEQLKKTLRKQGLAEGRVYRRAILDRLTLELRRQYYANGFYDVSVETKVTHLDGNRVDIAVHIDEGDVATIQNINIVGNESFSDQRLLDVFQLEASQSLLQQPFFWLVSDHYSRQKLLGDLETLNSFYQDRGYLRFHVSSIQVSLSPDKRNIYLTINVEEGASYTVDEIEFAGDLIVPERSLRRLVSVRSGETFSRQQVTATANRITSGLADFGYAFAEVDPLTRLNKEDHTVDLTFFVDPGKRAYVRRITFTGNDKTNDTTLRREMRQFEGGTFSRSAVKRSRVRLQRLPFIKSVEVETQPVPGTKDLVDVHFHVTERPAGTLQFGVGFSGAQGFLINARITHNNFRGTGNRISIRAQTNEFATVLAGSWTNPYFTEDGISQTISATYRKADQLIRFGSAFDLNTYRLGMTFGFPTSEYSYVSLGGGVAYNNITTPIVRIPGFGYSVSRELLDFINENGRKFLGYELRLGWERDTRNRTFFATRGTRTEVSFDFKLPGSDLEYYTASFEHERYFRIGSWFDWVSDKLVLESNIRIADTGIWGSGGDVPPYAHLFAGGARSVRGFQTGSLGPRDHPFNDPIGGQFLTTLQNELVIPTFMESDNKTTRFVLFYDIGNVFGGADAFEFDALRKSAGVAFYWFTPFFGLLRISYAAYVDSRPGDEVDQFQFSFGIGL